ncbi:hypothetical protein BaRGS_00008290, partial [Batillaria attramentaria]
SREARWCSGTLHVRSWTQDPHRPFASATAWSNSGTEIPQGSCSDCDVVLRQQGSQEPGLALPLVGLSPVVLPVIIVMAIAHGEVPSYPLAPSHMLRS